MPQKLKRSNCLASYPALPWSSYDDEDEETMHYPAVLRSRILVLPARSFRGLATALGKELKILAETLDAGSLVFFGIAQTPWLWQKNDYPPAKRAQDYLSAIGAGPRFNGGLSVTFEELPAFVPHLAWLSRCNAAMPYVYFIDPAQQLLGNICSYGNLHVDSLNEAGEARLTGFLQHSSASVGDLSSCFNRFGRSSALSGRRTQID